MYEIIDGKKVANELKEKISEEIKTLDEGPCLAVVIIGENPASKVYVNIKHKACEKVGIKSLKYELDEKTSQEDLLKLIDELNNDKKVNGILVQIPFPDQIDKNTIIQAISPDKDVDGIHPMNIGKLVIYEPCLKPCTPRGIMKLLNYYNINPKGKEVVVIGKSIIVGTPLMEMLKNDNATVTICHRSTKNLKEHTIKADIIISAVGKKNLITEDMVKEGAVVIDVGINKIDGVIYGDVDFENVKDKCSYITPVPGGVGPMTIACLLDNTLSAYKKQNGL